MEDINQNINKIKILPDFIANQIAAGEVVQRPESVVKELVENSLDSGADTIAVIIRGAGKQLIHVVDNGCGMSRDDLVISCRRHATSKIFSAEDLEEIRSFGFRGEALASIAAIAQIEIRTKTEGMEHGWKLLSEPMKPENTEPCNTENGTQVFVRNLFYNVPARRKFLKSNLTEFRYISDTMLKLALSKPEIRFTFYDEDTLIFDVHKSDFISRIAGILGESTADSLIPLSIENEYISLDGFVGQPHLAKQSRSGQFLFLNGRSIMSKSFSHAVYSAYEHLLDKSVNPFYIINLRIDPKSFDVNVHPQKHEVKFEDERFIYGIIHKAVNLALQKHNLAPEVSLTGSASQEPFENIRFKQDSGGSDLLLVNKLTGEVIEQGHRFSPESKQNISYGSGIDFREQNRQNISAYEFLFNRREDLAELNKTGKQEHIIPAVFFWQVHNKYIMMQSGNGITVIDQHAAHERILYEKAVKAMNNQMNYSQELLFPVNIPMNPSEISLIKEIEDDIRNLGYRFTVTGSETITLLAVPNDINSGDEQSSFYEIISEFEENQKLKPGASRDNLAASFSCKAAIKTGTKLTNEEMKRLYEDLMKCDTPFACPHGRPVIIEISLYELDKKFKRIL